MNPNSFTQQIGSTKQIQTTKHVRPILPEAPLLSKNLSIIAEVNSSFCEPNSEAIVNDTYSSEDNEMEDSEDEEEKIANSRLNLPDDYESTLNVLVPDSKPTMTKKRSRYEDLNSFTAVFSGFPNTYKRRSMFGSSSVFGSEVDIDTDHTNTELGSMTNYFNTKKITIIPSSPPVLDENWDDKGPILTSSPRREERCESDKEQEEKNKCQENIYREEKDECVNFNINRFNRIGAYLSSDPVEHSTYVANATATTMKLSSSNISHSSYQQQEQQAAINSFNKLINDAYDSNNSKIKAEGLSLRKLPDTVGDLQNLVITTKNNVVKSAEVELYLAKNQLKVLPPSIFQVDNCTVLSLRQNRIRKIPANISNLKNLHTLNVSVNELQVLPYQILKLSQLENFILRPNANLLELKDQEHDKFYQVGDENDCSKGDQRIYVSQIKWMDPIVLKHLPTSLSCSSSVSVPTSSTSENYEQILTKDKSTLRQISQVPRLSELTLRQIGNYSPSFKETQEWKHRISHNTQLKVTKAFQKRVFGERCAICESFTVDPVAKCLEWWNFKGERLCPIRLNFCSGRCIGKWIAGVEKDSEALNVDNNNNNKEDGR